MKNLLCACALSVAATSAFAGNYSEPYIEPEIVVTETVKSAGDDQWVIALMAFITIGLGIAGN